MHAYLIYSINKQLKHLEPNHSGHTRLMPVENHSTIFSQYRYEVMTDGKILHKKAIYYSCTTMCPFNIHDKDIIHWKFVLHFFLNCTTDKISYEETQDNIDMPNI